VFKDEVDKKERLYALDLVRDPEGKKFWNSFIGPEVYWIEWEKFILALGRYFEFPIQPDDKAVLKYLLGTLQL
jgi:hypothetical protein